LRQSAAFYPDFSRYRQNAALLPPLPGGLSKLIW
jgi:hypothetical protein